MRPLVLPSFEVSWETQKSNLSTIQRLRLHGLHRRTESERNETACDALMAARRRWPEAALSKSRLGLLDCHHESEARTPLDAVFQLWFPGTAYREHGLSLYSGE